MKAHINVFLVVVIISSQMNGSRSSTYDILRPENLSNLIIVQLYRAGDGDPPNTLTEEGFLVLERTLNPPRYLLKLLSREIWIVVVAAWRENMRLLYLSHQFGRPLILPIIIYHLSILCHYLLSAVMTQVKKDRNTIVVLVETAAEFAGSYVVRIYGLVKLNFNSLQQFIDLLFNVSRRSLTLLSCFFLNGIFLYLSDRIQQ